VIGTWPTETLAKAFKEHSVPFSPINSIKQLFATPEVSRMHLTTSIDAIKHGGRPLEFPKFPVRFAHLDHSEVGEPPVLGEHTEQILHETLRYSKAKI